jgi:hypothetical protein
MLASYVFICSIVLAFFPVTRAHGQYAVSETLINELWNGDSPFNYVNKSYIDHGYPHTNIQIEIIDAILNHNAPSFWVEAGSMLGGSIIKTAERIKGHNFNTSIVSIDPFSGDVNMLSWEHSAFLNNEWRFLRNEYGRPRIYDRFIANVHEAGHSDIVVPVCASAIVGMRYIKVLVGLNKLPSLPDVIYLDSAHEAEETLLELMVAWHTLKPLGVLFGDDWVWDTVRLDVLKFAQQVSHDIHVESLENIKKDFPDASFIDNVLVVKGQWIIIKK